MEMVHGGGKESASAGEGVTPGRRYNEMAELLILMLPVGTKKKVNNNLNPKNF